jgi:XTP/dITP diphosphohydrolase
MRKSARLKDGDAMSKNANNKVCILPKRKIVFFGTGNINKFNEAKSILSQFGLAVGMLRLKGDEIQSESLKEIAQKSALNAFARCHLPIFVEDAGLFVDALCGFPGPYAAYVFHTIHNSGILKLMENQPDRQAKFQSVIAFCDDQNSLVPTCFEGESTGEITKVERKGRGKSGFGFDPIFIPKGSDKTFAEMTIEEKNSFSHRSAAIRKFAQWFIEE